MSDEKFALTNRFSEKNLWKIWSLLTEEEDLRIPEDVRSQVRNISRYRDVARAIELSDELCSTVVLAQRKTDTHDVMSWYAVGGFLKKYPFAGDDSAREASALRSFYTAEEACKTFNLDGYKRLAFHGDGSLLTDMRNFIVSVIGQSPDLDYVISLGRHGPGKAIGSKRVELTTAYYKTTMWPYTVTKKAFPLARYAVFTDQRLVGYLQDSYRKRNGIPVNSPIDQKAFEKAIFTIVDGNEVTFVPKNAKTLRAIAFEPVMNLFLQLGAEGVIRKGLKRWGVDLDDQTRNQRYAKIGSLDDTLSTIDLQSASDSVSQKICELLLPPDWYSFLCKLRSESGIVDGKSVTYEKISSMGNGYTFALEALIFSSVCYATFMQHGLTWRSKKVAVYGDDIIVPSEISGSLIANLELCGFTVNTEKSFRYGNFKESCGTDYFYGTDVRPYFQTKEVEHVTDLFHLHNGLLKLFLKVNPHFEEAQSELFQYIRSLVPKEWRYFGPIVDTTNSHLFSTSYRHSSYVKWTGIRAKAQTFNNKDFLGRKLMNRLVPKQSIPRELKNLRYVDATTSSGSSFDITRRGCVDWVTHKYSVPAWTLSNVYMDH